MVDTLRKCEDLLLRGDQLLELPNIIPWISQLQKGDYNVIIESQLCRDIFSDYSPAGEPSECAIRRLSSRLEQYISKNAAITQQVEILVLGIASLQAFIQANWTGPEYVPLDGSDPCVNPFILKFLPEEIVQNKDIKESVRLTLAVDGEEICSSIQHPELLLLAQVFFQCNLPALRSTEWWLMRSMYIHQQILDEHSPTLKDRLIALSQNVHSHDWVAENKFLRVLLHLEVARVHLHYGNVQVSEQEIQGALGLLKMEVNLTGAMGRRTQYQRRDIAQLMIDVKIERCDGDPLVEVPPQDFPKDVLLNDDVRLPHVAFTNAGDGDYPELQPIEQVALIAVFVQKKKSQAKDHIQNEELMPFINCLLSHPKVWALEISALLFRSRIDCEHKRTIERALLQTQELMALNANSTSVPVRLNLFYCSYAPPSFIVASECASIMVAIGSMQSALDIYLKLQMWEEVITCYNYLKLRHRAAEVIKEQMKKGETVKLWCSLGDATDDVTCYERAWELSQHKSAQAQRHWGMFYFHRKNYKESIPHLKLSLQLNTLQVSLWFRLGYAALMEHEWEESAIAYRQYTYLEPESFEAWNNLAKAYILLGQKQRAYSALQEAIKCNYEMWQVWDNLMAVSSDCGDFEEVIHCYHRILDLKDKHIDEQILSVLVSVIVKRVKDCKGQPSSVHRKKALELFGRLTSKVMGNPIIWQLYADLTSSIEEQTPITRSKAVQYYQKAYTAAIQDNSWFKEIKSMHKILNICECLAEAHFAFVKECPSTNEAIHSLSSAKLSLQNILAKVTQHLSDFSGQSIDDKFNKDLASLQTTLESVIKELTNLKNSI
uniref:Tetratricopeptide repeat protein 27 n=1 Tax=Lygus hesperus TaxID=30085 RepID=A0A146LE10_LYGHE